MIACKLGFDIGPGGLLEGQIRLDTAQPVGHGGIVGERQPARQIGQVVRAWRIALVDDGQRDRLVGRRKSHSPASGLVDGHSHAKLGPIAGHGGQHGGAISPKPSNSEAY